MSWLAAVQRNRSFAKLEEKDIEKKRREFRKEIREKIYEMLPMYEKNVDLEKKHIENIKSLIQISEKYPEIFDAGGNDESIGKLNAGTAQKLLNMMLKYCWCAGWITMPPEMPIDSRNLDTLKAIAKEKGRSKDIFTVNWTTDIKDVAEYEKIMVQSRILCDC